MSTRKDYCMVTGMVRSGTTLISRALDAHSKSAIPPDPIFGFFRNFRNEVAEEIGPEFDEQQPLSSYYFPSELYLKVKHEIIDSTINRSIEKGNLDDIIEDIKKFAKDNSPLFIPELENIRASDYETLFKSLMDSILDNYGNKGTEIVGFKQTWVEIFSNPLLNSFSDLKTLFVIRDPRAIIASRKNTTHLRHNYPLDFILRHWRKSVAFATLAKQRYPDRVEIVRYEDFVNDPVPILKKLTSFFGINYENNMSKPGHYRDGRKNAWTDNSAYENVDTISSKFVDKWLQVLSQKELQYIEDLCGLEMELAGYDRRTEEKIYESIFYDLKLDEADTDWIDQYVYSGSKKDKFRNEELVRFFVSHNKYSRKFPKAFLEKAFVLSDFLRLGPGDFETIN